MEQTEGMQNKRRDLRGRAKRLLHSKKAAEWLGLLAVAGIAQVVSFIAISICFVAFRVIFQGTTKSSLTQDFLILGLSLVVALIAAIRVYRQKDSNEPPKKRIARKMWPYYRNGTALLVAVGVAYMTSLLLVLLLVAFLIAARRLVALPTGTGIVLLYSMVPIPVVLAPWAFIAWRHEFMEWLETAQPPELRLATKLIRHADDFRERARALEEAIEEAGAISKQIQRGIELEQQRLSELHQEKLRERLLKKLSDEEVSAIGFMVAEVQARSARRSRWWNVAFGVFGWAAGVVTQALIDTDSLREQFRQLLNFG
jgi:hypothetical protein